MKTERANNKPQQKNNRNTKISQEEMEYQHRLALNRRWAKMFPKGTLAERVTKTSNKK